MTGRVCFMIFCGVLIVLICGGLRQSFGVFLRPVSLDLEIGREMFGLVIAAQALIYGVSQPIVGMMADRFGAIRMIIAGAALYALGLWLARIATSATDLGLGLSLAVGLGLSGPTQVLVLGVVGKAVPENRRSVVFGTIIASSSLGMFLFVPGAQFLLDAVGWRDAFLYLSLLIVLVPFVAFGLGSAPLVPAKGQKQSLREAIDEAGGHSGYLLLTAGFFVCGFHVTFIATHLPTIFQTLCVIMLL